MLGLFIIFLLLWSLAKITRSATTGVSSTVSSGCGSFSSIDQLWHSVLADSRTKGADPYFLDLDLCILRDDTCTAPAALKLPSCPCLEATLELGDLPTCPVDARQARKRHRNTMVLLCSFVSPSRCLQSLMS